MSSYYELIQLFSKLASQLEPQVQDNQALDLTISNLSKSLNLNAEQQEQDGNFSTSILNTALSLMCFDAPQVFDKMTEMTVRTIITVLSSSVCCKTLRFQNDEALQVGGSLISCNPYAELIDACVEVVGKIGRHGDLASSLLYNVVRVVACASSYQYLLPSLRVQDVKINTETERRRAVMKLLPHFPDETQLKDYTLPLRMLTWYLDPLKVKSDISKILQEGVSRPFLSLNNEFHERLEWHSVVTSLALSPIMFIHARTLLHGWFLATGLASVLQLLNALVWTVLDLISGPSCWGIAAEVGTRLPCSKAYFPYKNHLLKSLDGPLSSETLIHIVQLVMRPVSHVGRLPESSTEIAVIDHRSSWAIAMNFLEWFYFASILLCSESKTREDFSRVRQAEQHDDSLPYAAAARYIAWMLNPINQANQDLLSDSLIDISNSWTLKQSAELVNKVAAGYKKKLKKPKYIDTNEDNTYLKGYDCQTILLWLNKFEKSCMRFIDENSYSSKPDQLVSLKKNTLYRRIVLGILMGCSRYINAEGCELLLHYAATGIILQRMEDQNSALYKMQNSEWVNRSVDLFKDVKRKEFMAGACLAFELTDVAEKMSVSMFDNQESGLDFVCRTKKRVFEYLMKCIKKLLEVKVTKDDYQVTTLMDLAKRLMIIILAKLLILLGDVLFPLNQNEGIPLFSASFCISTVYILEPLQLTMCIY